MKKAKYITMGIVFCLLAGIFLWRVRAVNAQYPQAKELFVKQGTAYLLQDGVEATITDSRWVDKDELEEQYAVYADYGFFVTLHLKNISDRPQGVSLCELYLEGDNYYSNGVAADIYEVLNSDVDLFEQELAANEEIDVLLPYEIEKTIYYSEKAWENIPMAHYALVRQRYPEKVYFLCTDGNWKKSS